MQNAPGEEFRVRDLEVDWASVRPTPRRPRCVADALVLEEGDVRIVLGETELKGRFVTGPEPAATVIVPRTRVSEGYSPSNRVLAMRLARAGLATLTLDLLTPLEESQQPTLHSDVVLLSQRLLKATEWLVDEGPGPEEPVGYFCEGIAAAAALVVSALERHLVGALLSRDGRPDLSGTSLRLSRAPTLLLVTRSDPTTLAANRQAFARLHSEKRLEELDEAPDPESQAVVARGWFLPRLAPLKSRLLQLSRGERRTDPLPAGGRDPIHR